MAPVCFKWLAGSDVVAGRSNVCNVEVGINISNFPRASLMIIFALALTLAIYYTTGIGDYRVYSLLLSDAKLAIGASAGGPRMKYKV